MLARGVVRVVYSGKKMQTLQLNLLAGDPKDDIEHFEPYGFTSFPRDGAEAIAAFFDGDRSHGVTLVVADRRYRLKSLAAGEVAIFDDQGQKVHLTRDGIIVSGKTVRVEGETIKFHATQSLGWDVAGFGESYTFTGGTNWTHKTWQTGATVTPETAPITPPEGA